MRWQERYAAFRPAFAEALDPRLYTIDHLDRMLLERSATVFFSENGAVVATIKTFPTGAKAIEFLIAAGPLDELLNDLRPGIETWGRQQGCTLALVESRPGWASALKPYNYETFQVSLIKDL